MARFISKLIFPNDLVSHVNFQDLSSRFSTYEVATAKLNVGDEMIKSKLKNLAKFKSITAGEKITVEQKCKNPIKIKPNVRQLYTANDLPEFDDGFSTDLCDELIRIRIFQHLVFLWQVIQNLQIFFFRKQVQFSGTLNCIFFEIFKTLSPTFS